MIEKNPLLENIKHCNALGVPFVYEGVEYRAYTPPNSQRRVIVCSVTDALAVPQTLHLMDGVTIVDDMQGKRIKVQEVIIPPSVEQIHISAFAKCTSLTTVHLMENSQLSIIRAKAFANCDNLTNINLTAATRLRYVTDLSFCGCLSLREITLPKSVSLVGDGAFAMCNSLQKIYLSRETYIPRSFAKALGCKVRTKKIYYD